MKDYTNVSDTELLALYAKNGECEAFDELVERYRRPLFSWFLGMTGSRADAEDLFQDLWVKAMKHAEGFKDVSFRAWMWKVARTTLVDHVRRLRPTVSLDETDPEDEDSVPLSDRIPDMRPTPDQEAASADMARRLRSEIARLPAPQREVVLMRTQGGLQFNEIAQTLGIPLGTALGRMRDAVAKLKAALTGVK